MCISFKQFINSEKTESLSVSFDIYKQMIVLAQEKKVLHVLNNDCELSWRGDAIFIDMFIDYDNGIVGFK